MLVFFLSSRSYLRLFQANRLIFCQTEGNSATFTVPISPGFFFFLKKTQMPWIHLRLFTSHRCHSEGLSGQSTPLAGPPRACSPPLRPSFCPELQFYPPWSSPTSPHVYGLWTHGLQNSSCGACSRECWSRIGTLKRESGIFKKIFFFFLRYGLMVAQFFSG